MEAVRARVLEVVMVIVEPAKLVVFIGMGMMAVEGFGGDDDDVGGCGEGG